MVAVGSPPASAHARHVSEQAGWRRALGAAVSPPVLIALLAWGLGITLLATLRLSKRLA